GMAFTFALAGARLILALGFTFATDQARRVAIGYGVSPAGVARPGLLPRPGPAGRWGGPPPPAGGPLPPPPRQWGPPPPPGEGARQPRERNGARPPHRARIDSAQGMLTPPSDPARRIDAAHLSERFGLMMMILLGEVVVAVAGSAAGVDEHGLRYWSGLLAG